MAKRAALGAQIRPRRAQVRRFRGIKRRSHVLRACSSFTARTNPSWGSKRVRTARCQKALSGVNRRDWSDIGGDGPAGLIAELVLAKDVADYVRFRAACRPWRLCSVDPRSSHSDLDGRFLPRNWIMLDRALTAPRCHRRRFLNVSTGECIRTDLPELADHTLLALTPEGLLLLLHEPTLVIRLLNPLTRRLTDLPPVTALLTPKQQQDWRSGVGALPGDALWVCGVGLADDASTVAVCFRRPKTAVIAKPGDEHWTVVENSNRYYIDSTLPFAGRFYCAVGSSILVLGSDSASGGQWRLLTAVEGSKPLNFCRMSDSLHLVDNGRELMLVHRMLRAGKGAQGAKHTMEYEVYRVDFDAGDLVPVKSLGGRAVFIGRRRSVSLVPAEAFPRVSADTLYLGYDCDEKRTRRMNRIDGYNVADGTNERCYHDKSFVDCLSRCIRGTGKHLA